MTTETGLLLAELHARSGLTWGQLAGAIGASSGDYVRKVASGAKPGNNLTGAVSQLMGTGKVTDAPARRTAAGGGLARVRAPRSAGVRSVVPTPQAAPVKQPRNLFRMAGGRLGWGQTVGNDPRAIRDALTSAGRGHHRVSFRVQRMDAHGRPRWVTIGQHGGYDPAMIRRDHGGDLLAWLGTQAGDRYGGEGEILDVEVIAE